MHTADRILRASWRLFERRGEPGVSARKVAEAVGLSPMAVYRHYESRDALLAALTEDSLEVWRARVRAVRGRTTVAWLTRLAETYLRFALDEPRRFEACFELSSRGVRKVPSEVAAGPGARVILDEVARGLARGELHGADALTIVVVLWGEVHGLIRLFRDGQFDSAPAFERIYRRCVQLVLSTFVVARKGRTS